MRTSNIASRVIMTVVAILLQLVIAPNIAILGVAPNFLLIITIIAALVDGPVTGALIGFILGLVFDLIGTGPIGPMAFVGTLVGYIAGLLHTNLSGSNWVMALTVFALCSFLADFTYALILEILTPDFSFWSAVLHKVIPSTLYNTAIALAVFPFLSKVLAPKQSYMTVKKRY